MKIDDLVKNLEQNTAAQTQAMSSQVQNAINQHLEKYNKLLSENRQQTTAILREQLELVENHGKNLKKVTTGKMITAGVIVLILSIALGMLIMMKYLDKQLTKKSEELANIEAQIEQAQNKLSKSRHSRN